MPSLPVLSRVRKEENQTSRLVYEVPSHTRFIKQVQTPFLFPKSVHMSNKDVHTKILVLGLTKHNISEGMHTQIAITKLFVGHSIQKHKSDSGHSHSRND